jgi:hypothetical protein
MAESESLVALADADAHPPERLHGQVTLLSSIADYDGSCRFYLKWLTGEFWPTSGTDAGLGGIFFCTAVSGRDFEVQRLGG